MRRYGVQFLMLVSALFLVACGQTSSEGASGQSSTGEDNVLLVGMEANYPPANWTQNDDSNGAVPIQGSNQFANGLDVQMAKIIGEHLGREVVVVKTKWEGLIPGLQADKFDLIVAGMAPTPERAEVINFSDPYTDGTYTIVTLADSPYAGASSVEDFADARITAQQGTMHYELLDQFTGADVQEAMGDFGSMRVALQSGKIDAYISTLGEAISATQAMEDLAYEELEDINVPEGKEPVSAIGVKKGNDDLLQQVNEAIATVSSDERRQLLEEAIANQPSEQ